MNENIRSEQISNEPPSVIPRRFSRGNDPCKVLQPVPARTDNANNILDYKNISLSLTGEVSSGSIHRNSLALKQCGTSFFEVAEEEEDDERFISDMKKKIEQNCKLRNNENYSIRDLQSKSYSAKRRKCALSDEDQNLMKRFKRSVESKQAVCVTPQSHNAFECDAITSPVAFSNTNCGGGIASRVFFHVASTIERDDPLVTPESARNLVTGTEIERLYYEMQCFTPPERND